jgi:predicted nuclease with RNAse H fold
MSHTLFGIDYGSKLSGNTVISILKSNKIYFMAVDKNTDADEFIYNAALHFKPDVIFLDAPLSLPGIYSNKPGDNYHFRKADLDLCAMSPMFLGGLTARAMQLKDRIEKELESTKVYETFPRAQARNYELEQYGYKKRKSNLVVCSNRLREKLNQKLFIDCLDIKTWHHLDALLALFGAMRFVMGLALPYGDEEEGLIYV